ncbi:hypothetical protein K2173_007434 [Erythroxylum novogranatense]|uniref:Glycosyltransferase family 92 protein n=1 Tax=Erythroxylum novogranatense TaxID=1862640 RepID=A0AAV8T672_9ROSI|nr:hypothetical protein K2173_007434 [Erythroxylum novogranatense]
MLPHLLRGGYQGGGGGAGGKEGTLLETMRRSAFVTILYVIVSVFLFATFSLYSSRNPVYVADLFNPLSRSSDSSFRAIREDLHNNSRHRPFRQSNSSDQKKNVLMTSPDDESLLEEHSNIDSESILFPDWEVFVIVSTDTPVASRESLLCRYPNEETSPARFAGILASTNQSTFKCELPTRNRRRLPFLSPELTTLSTKELKPPPPAKELMKWSLLAYESFSMETDVVLFVKGVNNRQGMNRPARGLKCIFSDVASNRTVRTAVTSSVQEVFRCAHPDLTALGYNGQDDPSFKVKVSLEISEEVLVVPTVAYYTPWCRIANPKPKSELCATTMVYNVAKFLREWVMYHSKVGVDKFILYDNDSDDGLNDTVEELNEEGYRVETVSWIWPKTQEAGFSHAAIQAKDSCKWMMYLDVDEFVFSASWENSSEPSDQMLKSLIPRSSASSTANRRRRRVGQVSMKCYEFGPSNQRCHPQEGVTQGYTCRRKSDNRHKSIVLLEAIDHSLVNVIHHFTLKREYKWRQLNIQNTLVNHYKYQAWPEFKLKFRRRVSAYVVDWKKAENPSSKDRAPGLGFEPIEPAGWEHKFCEVKDDRLKMVTQKWFGYETVTGYVMAWQR